MLDNYWIEENQTVGTDHRCFHDFDPYNGICKNCGAQLIWKVTFNAT